MPALSNVSGFPRIGAQRELKVATESFWSGERSQDELLATARDLRAANWKLQRESGIDLIPSNDFSFYDQVLDTIALVGAVPERYGWDPSSGTVDLDTYFAMARGRQGGGVDVTAMEMTKWFDTNYHYIVPELRRDMDFRLSSRKPFEQYEEAKALGIETKPVLIGPLTLLLQGKCADGEFDRLELLDGLLPRSTRKFSRSSADAAPSGSRSTSRSWSRTALPPSSRRSSAPTRAWAASSGAPKILVNTYFDHVGEAYPVLTRLPVAGHRP